jgi:hypothetical protein
MAATGNTCFSLVNFFKSSLNASYQVSVHLAERLKCEKLTDDRRRTQTDGKSSKGELKSSSRVYGIFKL